MPVTERTVVSCCKGGGEEAVAGRCGGGAVGAVVRGGPAWTLGSEAAAPAAPGWGVPQPPVDQVGDGA
jgi:hypothetical protein